MTLEKLILLICEEFNCTEDDVYPDITVEELLAEDGHTELRDLTAILEREFGVEFEHDLTEDMSVEEIADIIDNLTE